MLTGITPNKLPWNSLYRGPDGTYVADLARLTGTGSPLNLPDEGHFDLI